MPEANSIPVFPNLAGRCPGQTPEASAKPTLLDRLRKALRTRHSFAAHLPEGCCEFLSIVHCNRRKR